jgi:hypothetical protein
LPDTAAEPATPWAEVAFVVEHLDATRLVGHKFMVPHGRTVDDDFAFIYYYEHEELNDNSIEFLDRRQDHFLIRWKGTTQDVNFYDGSKPEAKVAIEGWFTFKDFEKWLGK